MAHQSGLTDKDILRDLEGAKNKSLLRFMTCGSVDDGKSTLIGRLLSDSQMIFDDQLAALEQDSRKMGTTDGEIDFALLLDGLQAEREQGITIDVAYRYFSTDKRKFIVADTPGHEQYTRNMVTGASTVELAVILIDARKGILVQSRRHAYLVSLLGIRHVVLAVNKMDLVAYDQMVFDEICDQFSEFADRIGINHVQAIPLSALKGDNILNPGGNMPWYQGPPLLAYLETVETSVDHTQEAFRFPVQWVNRPNPDFRGYSGTIASGRIRVGDGIIVASSQTGARVERIVTMDGDLPVAETGQAVTLVLGHEIDISRGDVLAPGDRRPDFADQFVAHVVWLHEEALLPARRYDLKLGSQTVTASITELKYKVNVNTLGKMAGKTLELNEVAKCAVSVDRGIVFDPYAKNHYTGSFILIDRFTNATLGAGMIDHALRRATNIVPQELDINKAKRSDIKGQKGGVLWFTGLSGSGKSTVANIVEKKLYARGRHTYILDGDNVRFGLNKNLGFTDVDRVENIRRVGEVARLMVDAGLIVLVSFISPFISERRMARDLVEANEFLEIFIDTPLEICEQRDPKGLYKKARAGEIKNFTGIDSVYERPERADIHLQTAQISAEAAADQIIAKLVRRGMIGS